MAKFIPGPLVAEIRNKLGNQVFFRNRHGACTRGYALPDQTLTPARVTTQDRFQTASAAWNSPLTDLDRAAWMALAERLGSRPGPVNGRKWSGRTLFLSTYCNLDNIGIVPYAEPPDSTLSGQLIALTATCDIDAQSLIITGNQGQEPPDQGLVIMASPPLNPARYSARDLWRQIAAIPPNPSFPIELWPDYVAVHPWPNPGQVIILGASPVAAETGLAGPRQTARCIVTGTGETMFTSVTDLTAAQVKTLFSVGRELVAAPGAAKVIVPIRATIEYKFVTTAYTIGGGSAFSFAPTGASTPASLSRNLASLIDQASSRLAFSSVDTAVGALTNATNKGLTVKCTVADPTLGDGLLRITVDYSVADVL